MGTKKSPLFFALVFSLIFFAQGWASNDWTTNDSKLAQGQVHTITIGKFLVRLPDDRSGFYRAPKGEKLPAHFDWRNNGGDYTTIAKDQGACGSCAAFSAVGAFEAVINIANGNPNLDLNLSEQHLFSCGGGRCNYGMYVNDAMDYLRNYGIPSESCFPYRSGSSGADYPCSSTCSDWQPQAKKINNWWFVSGDINSMKSAIYNYGPIVTGFYACNDLAYNYHAGEIYTHSGSCSGCTGHGVAIVGWDDSQQYWIIKNSWGPGWGDSGFFNIRWGTCEIDSSGSSFGIAMTYTPSDDDGDDDDDSGDVCDDVCYKFRYCGLISDNVSDAECADFCHNDMTSDERDCVHGADTCGKVKDCMGLNKNNGGDDDNGNPSLIDLLGCSFAGSKGTTEGFGFLLLVAIGLGLWLRKK